MSDTINLGLQVELCLGALEAILPFADAAGIATDFDEAYDEWEDIVQAVFSSFVLRPVCDTSTCWSLEHFKRLGFERDGEARAAVFLDHESLSCYIFDIAKVQGDNMRLVLRLPDRTDRDVLATPAECVNFRLGQLPRP